MAEPAITVRAAHDSGAGNLPVLDVIIHSTCGGRGYPAESAAGAAHSTALYFANANAGGSAQYVIDVASEEHCVPENVISWNAPPNDHTVGIEICSEGGEGYPKDYSRDEWLSPQVWPAVQRAAARARDVCLRHNVPMVKRSAADLVAGKHGIQGHADRSAAFHQSTHTDPGPNFPWAEFMAEVTSPQGGFLMALSDAQQAEIYSIVKGLGTINPPYTTAPTPTQLVLGDIFVQARKAAAAKIDTAALAAALAKELPQGTAPSQSDLIAALRTLLGLPDNAPTAP